MRLAHRTFTAVDQQRFASVSGDHNPIHMDAVLARRTQAGAPVVHGIHLLLWTLDMLAASRPDLPPLSKLRAQFNRFVYLDEAVDILVTQQKPTAVRLKVSVDGMDRSKFNLEFAGPVEPSPEWLKSSLETIAFSPLPREMDFNEMSAQSGKLAFRMANEDALTMFPAAARWLGPERVAALAASTHLVGMILPGLHSIYTDLVVNTSENRDPQECLGFQVASTDARFRTVELEIAGGGLTGAVTAIARHPPQAQAAIESLAGVVPDEFAGTVALIVGGSRGLGELTAKVIAKGGGRVVITWQSGSADAERVAEELRAAGGICETLAFDARKPAAEQLAALSQIPTHLYYFATPPIFRAQSHLFVSERLKEFLAVYVDGFWELAQALRERQPRLSLFYPSSVAVEQRPRGMTEYAMAKAAGEALCADMNVSLGPIHVTQSRLPRLPTDQTASVAEVDTADAFATMLPIIREVQSWPR